MTENYISGKIQEALKATGGDKKDATKLLITWAVRDQALLLGLTKAHLKDIAEERVEAIAKSMKKTPSIKKPVEKSDKPAIQFGDKRRAVKVPPPKTSERQASVMHQLAAAFKRNK